MKKREFSKININETDRKIIDFCAKDPKPVMEIKEHLGIAHKNLKPHLDKLNGYGVIDIEPQPNSQTKLVSVNSDSWLFGHGSVFPKPSNK